MNPMRAVGHDLDPGLAFRRTLSRIGPILLLGLLAISCTHWGIRDQGNSLEPAPGQELQNQSRQIVVGLSEQPTSLDPADQLSDSSEIIIRNIFSGLVTRDHANGVHLDLAESISSPDDRTLLIQLRRGVLFHDGVELTSRDVVYSFNRIIQENALSFPEPHSSPKQALAAPLESVEALDRYTVLMRLSDPWPAAVQLLVHLQIVPMHYLEFVGDEAFQRHPIGTGPFSFIHSDDDHRRVVLKKFEAYFGGAPTLEPVGPACLDHVVFMVVPDPRLRMAALAVGELDLIQAASLTLPEEISDDPQLQVKAVPGTHPIWLELNVNKQPFNDLRVRQALNYAVDKELLAEKVYHGKAVVLSGPLSPYNEFVGQDLDPYPYEPDQARMYLARSGWMNFNGEWLQRPEGDPFRMTIDTTLDLEPLAKALAEQYRDLGIQVSIRVWEPGFVHSLMQSGERDAFLGDWGDPAFDPIGHFDAKWHGRVEGEAYGSVNFSGYDNERVNNLIRAGETTANPAERYELYNEAQQIIHRDAPAVFLLLPQSIEAASVELTNWAPAADGSMDLHDVCIQPGPYGRLDD